MKHATLIFIAFLSTGWTVRDDQASVKNLVVGCMNGRPQARLTLASPLPQGLRVGVAYRVDDGPVVPLVTYPMPSGIYPWPAGNTPLDALRTAKRLRVDLTAAGANAVSLDYDLTEGGSEPSCQLQVLITSHTALQNSVVASASTAFP